MIVPDQQQTERMADQEREDLVADGLMTVAEVARFLRLSRSSIYSLMANRLPYVRFGRARRVPRRAVVALAAEALIVGQLLER